MITVGIINGGLGFQFASTFPDQQPSNAPRVVYGVIATLVWIIYVSIIAAWTELERNPTCVGTRHATTGLTQTAGRRSPVDTPTTGNSADDLQSHGVSETDADQDITEVVQREPKRDIT